MTAETARDTLRLAHRYLKSQGLAADLFFATGTSDPYRIARVIGSPAARRLDDSTYSLDILHDRETASENSLQVIYGPDGRQGGGKRIRNAADPRSLFDLLDEILQDLAAWQLQRAAGVGR